MKNIKKYVDFINEEYYDKEPDTYIPISVYMDLDNIYIETDDNPLATNTSYILPYTQDNIISWYVDKYGRTTFTDEFNPEEGHYTKEWEMSDDEIMNLIENSETIQREFAIENRENWIDDNE